MPSVSQTPIDQRLDQLIPKRNELPYSAARYAVFSGGKRFRPNLVLAIAGEKGLDGAAAIECMHTFSLIHDDLPCMDNDDFRRDKPTLHRVVGDGQALLAGDYLQSLAFDILANSKAYTDAQKIELISELSRGCNQMIDGQVSDLLGGIDEWEKLIEMHLGKTGALMRTSLLFGAIIAELPREPLAACGEALGIAFQLFDDIKDEDVDCDPEHLLEKAQEYKAKAFEYAQGYPTLQQIIESLY